MLYIDGVVDVGVDNNVIMLVFWAGVMIMIIMRPLINVNGFKWEMLFFWTHCKQFFNKEKKILLKKNFVGNINISRRYNITECQHFEFYLKCLISNFSVLDFLLEVGEVGIKNKGQN